MIDPFEIKKHSKLSPRRLLFTGRARFEDFRARRAFEALAAPQKIIASVPDAPADVAWADTSVTKEQMRHLLQGLADTEALGGGVVEVGCFRGVTTTCLAAHTRRTVYAVDPFIGYGAAESDFAKFRANIAGRDNIVFLRGTSGSIAKNWPHGPVSFVFIDAVHDYANTSFDAASWWSTLAPGGIMAFHDTDDARFPGTRRAVHEFLARDGVELYAHPDNVTLARKTSRV